MALTRLIGANALSGNIPAANFNNASLNSVTAIPSSIATGEMKLISTATASASASIEFTLGDYKEYQFYFVNIHASTDNYIFQFNFSTDNGSNYNVTKTSTAFMAAHFENDASPDLSYRTDYDLAQSTGFQAIGEEMGIDDDQSLSGYFQLFNPSSSTYIKHFIGNSNTMRGDDYLMNQYIAGYGNTTSALTNIKFQMSSGNIDAGSILMFGIN